MWQKICKFLLHTLGGWRVEMTVPHQDKCIICVAPHTSNWDFIIAELYYHSIGRRAGFLMKREWFFWPMGCLFRSLGGVPVERSRKTSLTDQLAERAKAAKDHFELAVTPEGTRSLSTQWKRGFYFIVCTKTLYPTGNVEADMREIMEYYRPYQGKYPGKFAVEEIPAVSSPAK